MDFLQLILQKTNIIMILMEIQQGMFIVLVILVNKAHQQLY